MCNRIAWSIAPPPPTCSLVPSPEVGVLPTVIFSQGLLSHSYHSWYGRHLS